MILIVTFTMLPVNHKNSDHNRVSSEDFEILSVLGTGGETK